MAPSEVCPPTHKLEIRGMLTSDKVLTPAAEALTAQAPVTRSPTARVLIVDDEPAACKLLALLLSEADFECKTALSGAEALRRLENGNHDAIVCDLNMPGMTGMELLAEVRRPEPSGSFSSRHRPQRCACGHTGHEVRSRRLSGEAASCGPGDCQPSPRPAEETPGAGS